MKYIRTYQTIKDYNADIDDGKLIDGEPYVSFLRSDLRGGDNIKYGIEEKIEPLTMWIDDYPSIAEFNEEFYKYSSLDDYLDDYLEDPESFDSDCFVYMNETVEYDGVTYYAWQYVKKTQEEADGFYLTNTIDFNTLSGLSIEANHRNRNCPVYAYLSPDLEEDPYIKNYDDPDRILVKVENVNGELRMWIDGFPTLFSEFYYLSENMIDYDDYFAYLFSEGGDYNQANEYCFTGETIDYDGETYYLWEYQGNVADIKYMLTQTANFNELYNLSIESDTSNRNCPVYAILNEDMQEYMKTDYQDDNYVLLKVEKNT